MRIPPSAALVLAVLAAFPAAAADAPIKGAVVLAQARPIATFVWDATPALADLQAAHASKPEALGALEADAVAIMLKRAPESAAATIRVRVVYARTNLGAEYGDPSMDKKSDLVILTATRADVAANAEGWQAALRAGKPVRSLGIDVRDAIPNP